MADINVGAISEALNNKADVDLHNLNNEGKKSVTLAGMVMAFAGSTPPTGWLKCDGSAVSRTTYASLFVAIGTKYGAGDGSTTFNLPNLTGRVPLGMDGSYVGKSTNGVLPNITGAFGVYGQVSVICNTEGAFYFNNDRNSGGTDSGWGSGSNNRGLGRFNASRSSSIYGSGWFDGTRVVPASVGMTYCIKY